MKQLILLSEEIQGSQAILTGEKFHYLSHVRRVQPGEALFCRNTQGKEYLGIVSSMENNRILLSLSEREKTIQVEPYITLFVCLLKGKKLDQVIRQATETGVSSIYLVVSDFTVARIEPSDWDKKKLRFEKIIHEAAQQSGASVLPSLKLIKLKDIAKEWKKKLLFCHQDDLQNCSLHSLLSTEEEVGILIGPEGGLSPGEVDFLLRNAYSPVHLGQSILRAETAAVYTLGAVKTILREKTVWKTVRNESE